MRNSFIYRKEEMAILQGGWPDVVNKEYEGLGRQCVLASAIPFVNSAA
jgi:hypothetical protein